MKTVETSVKNKYKPNCRNGDIVIIQGIWRHSINKSGCGTAQDKINKYKYIKLKL